MGMEGISNNLAKFIVSDKNISKDKIISGKELDDLQKKVALEGGQKVGLSAEDVGKLNELSQKTQENEVVFRVLNEGVDGAMPLEFDSDTVEDKFKDAGKHCDYEGVSKPDTSKWREITKEERFANDKGFYDYGIKPTYGANGQVAEIDVFCDLVKGTLSKDTIIGDIVDTKNLSNYLDQRYPTPESLKILPAKVSIGKDEGGKDIIKTFSNDEAGRKEFIKFSADTLKTILTNRLAQKEMPEEVKDFDDKFKLVKSDQNGETIWMIKIDTGNDKPDDKPEVKEDSSETKVLDGDDAPPNKGFEFPTSGGYPSGKLSLIPKKYVDAGGYEQYVKPRGVYQQEGSIPEQVLVPYRDTKNNITYQAVFYAEDNLKTNKIELNFKLNPDRTFADISTGGVSTDFANNPLRGGIVSDVSKNQILDMASTDYNNMGVYDGFHGQRDISYVKSEITQEGKMLNNALKVYYFYMDAVDNGYKGSVSEWLKDNHDELAKQFPN